MAKRDNGKTAGIDPIFISVKEAAAALGITEWSVYRLCDANKIVAQYHGRRRLVRVDSVRDYADSLPTTPAGA